MLHRTVNITLCNLVGYTDHVHFPYVAAQAAHFIANVWLLDCNLWGHKLCHFLHLESENQNSLLVFAHSACRYKKICKVLHRAVNIYFYQATNHTKQCMLALCIPEPCQFRVVKGRQSCRYTDHAHCTYAAAQAAHFIANVWLLDCNLWDTNCHFSTLKVKIKIPSGQILVFALVFAHSA